MTTPIVDALKAKYKTPKAVLNALGLDEGLLRGDKPKKRSAVEAALVTGIKAKTGIAEDAELKDLLEMLDALKATQEGSIKEIEAAEVEAGEAEGEEGEEDDEGEEVPGEEAPSDHDDEYEPDKPANPKESKDVAGITGENAGVPALAEKDKKEAKVEEVGGEKDISADGDPATKLHMILKDKLSQEEMKAVGEILADLAGKGPEEDLDHQENENEAEPKVKPEGEDEDDAEDEGGESETEKKEVGEAEKVDELKEKKRAAGMDAAIKLAVDAMPGIPLYLAVNEVYSFAH